ncbi:cell division protein FtsQ/DivIB [Dehalobacterium formicoaceticum]|uniref:FtsQ-type POTRA domain-containing protein n=1 Tax=Dehalobacterium formicoaceticum TaxID=51515 RepID=A0ABT1Y0W2_9FIRM|nr:FtsQ-type POTRA domain-containing protein [Dehalobacterium formicoaceticum]MCR6544483.1 FtsQ-type POTRA domain-containing protein [Dehalobacterium formicoaceticum]
MEEGKRVRYVRRKNRPGNVKWLIKTLILVFCLFSGYYFIHSSFFAISSIEVLGIKELTSAQIVALSGLSKGENIFQIDRSAAESKIALNTMVAGVEVKRKLPRSIQINILERVPVALIPVTGGLIEIDHEGLVLKKVSQINQESRTIITGMDIPSTMAVGKKVSSEKLEMGLAMIAQMDEEARKTIAEINVFNPQKILAYTVEGTEVRFGNQEDFQEKFTRFLQVLKEVKDGDQLKNIEYIDVSFSGKPVIFYRK